MPGLDGGYTEEEKNTDLRDICQNFRGRFKGGIEGKRRVKENFQVLI